MKIQSLQTFIVGNPPPGFGGRYFIFLKLETNTGITGLGEVYGATFGPNTIVTMIEDVFQRHLEGRDPFKIEAMWRRVYGAGYSLRPDLSLMGVLNGLEMACWDIIGKAVDRPVYDLLGGQVHETLRSYTYIYPKDGPVMPNREDGPSVCDDPDMAAERAVEYLCQGFTALKFDPAGPTRFTMATSQAWKIWRVRSCSAGACAKPWAPGRICCSAPTVSSRCRAPNAWPGAWKPTNPCGSRNPHRPKTLRPWPRWPALRPFPSPRESA